MTEIPDKRYFRPDELAKELQIRVDTVRRWIRNKQVRVLRLPGKTLIPHDEFIRAIQSGPRPRPL